MAKIDLYDPRWVDMVFAGKNKAYGAYKLRKETSHRNAKALLILIVVAALIGGFLYVKIKSDKDAEARQAYIAEMQASRLANQMKKQEKKIKIPPKVQPKKEIPIARATQKFTAPVIRKDDLVKEDNQIKQMDKLDDRAVGAETHEGTNSRTVEAVRNDVAVNTPPPAPAEEASNKVFTVVEQMPSFPGGMGALNSYLHNNVRYPTVAQENGVQGRVVVSFVVERDGSITDVQVARSVDPSLDKEAVRVINSMPKWQPGKQNGSSVRVKYNVPVNFKLQQ